VCAQSPLLVILTVRLRPEPPSVAMCLAFDISVCRTHPTVLDCANGYQEEVDEGEENCRPEDEAGEKASAEGENS